MKKANYYFLILCSFIFTSLNVNASGNASNLHFRNLNSDNTCRTDLHVSAKEVQGSKEYEFTLISITTTLENNLYKVKGVAKKIGTGIFENISLFTRNINNLEIDQTYTVWLRSDINVPPIPYLIPASINPATSSSSSSSKKRKTLRNPKTKTDELISESGKRRDRED